ncbi:CRISPR-associated protein Cas4 [Atopobium sp. oral taxon 810]|uniref:CRISPR-associated protein Cas4 n=1 Tax=Atopobium sp. oral taxon 810 TaxID=712158 RepID=UPI0003981404|nr:CRISPR-associated protein Cas4 [Atopobium sp. oral taxon 810]ERI04264.1 CRISPR-associated protein Cas4 [Atopobium sp. oral taxon 810 str. F0209]
MYADDELLALSGLQHLAYCERQWALIHLEQVWEDSADTLRGDYFHERVDTVGYSCADGVRSERRVRLVSRTLGIYGTADIVEYGVGDAGSFMRPVEYKVGKPRAEDWDRLQVTAQALCLEEMHGGAVTEGAIFYGETRRRERVEVSKKLRDELKRLASHMHVLFESSETPHAEMGAKCRRCSLADWCMPKTGGLNVRDYWARYGGDLVN